MVYRDLRHHAYPADMARKELAKWGVPQALLENLMFREGLIMGSWKRHCGYCKDQVWDTVECEEDDYEDG